MSFHPGYSSIISLHCCLFVFIFSCRHASSNNEQRSISGVLLQCTREYHIDGLSYFVAENGHLTGEHYFSKEDTVQSASAILTHFTGPLLLDRMIRDSIIREEDSATPWLCVRELICVPAGYYERGKGSPDPMTERIQGLLAKHPYSSSDHDIEWMRNDLRTGRIFTMRSLFHELWRGSAYFDAVHPEYAFSQKAIYNVMPTWYTKGLSGFFGWRILKFQGQTILWNSFSDGGKCLLVIKFVDKKIFVAVSCSASNLPSPTSFNKEDLLQSPLALSIFKALYLTRSTIDYTFPADSLFSRLEAEAGSYNFIYQHDLVAHARLCQQEGRGAQADQLYHLLSRLTKDSLLTRYVNKPVLSEIGYVSDGLTAIQPFSLSSPSAIQLFAGGQLRAPHDYSNESYLFDNVQLFINDHEGERGNSWLNTRMLQFNYGSSVSRVTAAECAVRDVGDSAYTIEARIQWESLNPGKHFSGRNILANILISDCDLEENQRKSVLSWSVAQNDNFADEKKFGRIKLCDRLPAGSMRAGSMRTGSMRTGKVAYAPRTSRPPVIDGIAEDVWEKAAFSTVGLTYQGSTSARDNAGQFKVMYDEKYLYLLVRVTDNCRNPYGNVTADKCWIEDANTGLPVWKMNGNRTEAFPGFSCNERTCLPAGQYLLKYVSDKGHSYEHWYGPPPANGIYGASVYLAQQ